MSIKQTIKEIFVKKKERVYTPQELEEFHKELEPYRIGGEIDGRKVKYLSVGSEFAYLQDKGIVKSKEKITPSMRGMSKLPIDMRITDNLIFAEHENKMRQYWNWKSKGDYIFQKNIEDYEKVAKSFPPILEEEIIPEEIPF